MTNTQDLLGALLRRGMTGSSTRRIEHSLGEKGGLGDVLQQQLGISPAAAPAAAATQTTQGGEVSNPLDALGSLGNIVKSIFGEVSQSKSAAAGGLGALLGAIAGGGGKSAKGALGGGALALLGSIALKALRNASQQPSQSPELDPATRLAAGLREPQNAQEENEVQSIADLTVKAMVNAAKADGRIDEDEMQKVVGELQEGGITQTERAYLLDEVRKPSNIDAIVRAVPNRQVAAQIYACLLYTSPSPRDQREHLV